MTKESEISLSSTAFVTELGKKVKSFRQAKQLTQAEAAKLCGVGTRFLSNLENGKPTVEMAKAVQVLHALNLELNLTDTPRRNQQKREKTQRDVLARLTSHPYLCINIPYSCL